jgi:prepilin-type N-terminal cleavage/methylation domain-containing protein
MKPNQKGFTLIELLVVISVTGFLSSTLIVTVNKARANSRYSKIAQDMRQMATAAELYAEDFGTYPIGSGFTMMNGVKTASTAPFPAAFSNYMKTDGLLPPCPNWNYLIMQNVPTGAVAIGVRKVLPGMILVQPRTYLCVTGDCKTGFPTYTPVQDYSHTVVCD